MKRFIWCQRRKLICWWRRYHAWIPAYRWSNGDLNIACQDCCAMGFVDFYNFELFDELHEPDGA